jgi:hypothetical protein
VIRGLPSPATTYVGVGVGVRKLADTSEPNTPVGIDRILLMVVKIVEAARGTDCITVEVKYWVVLCLGSHLPPTLINIPADVIA